MFVGPRRYGPADKPAPFGTMFAALLRLLAWEDPQLRSIADYFTITLQAAGEGFPRIWPWDVYTARVRSRAESGNLTQGDRWDEWNLTIY